MVKFKSMYVCTECAAVQAKWQGQCPDCGAWNSLQETANIAASASGATPTPAGSLSALSGGYSGVAAGEIEKLADIISIEKPRLKTCFSELDRVLGGGLVMGSVVLIGGHPGAGKSTLLLQLLADLSKSETCLYVTGEESPQQVSLRARRLGLAADKLSLMAETQMEVIVKTALELKPKVLVIDSIQVMHVTHLNAAAGSVSQVRESAALLTRFAKASDTVVLLVGHVTKEGMLAGPKVLEHMIDCSLLLESTENQRFRLLRSQKNRFGAVHEMGVFAMVGAGLKEVKNPSALFLSKHTKPAPGSVVTILWEGTRSLLVELQALVDEKQGGYPARVSVGTDGNRLAMLLAIMHKHGGFSLGDQDVFINLVGGVKSIETGVDLAVIFAMVSSFTNRIIPAEWVVLGEVGLSGEIRPVQYGHERLLEAYKHGFKKAILSKSNANGFEAPNGFEVVPVSRLSEALECLQELSVKVAD